MDKIIFAYVCIFFAVIMCVIIINPEMQYEVKVNIYENTDVEVFEYINQESVLLDLTFKGYFSNSFVFSGFTREIKLTGDIGQKIKNNKGDFLEVIASDKELGTITLKKIK